MKTREVKGNIICDMPGCKNLAAFHFSLGDKPDEGLNLCGDCVRGICAFAAGGGGKFGKERK